MEVEILFKVWFKAKEEAYVVYDVKSVFRADLSTEIQFLIFYEGSWRYLDSRLFEEYDNKS